MEIKIKELKPYKFDKDLYSLLDQDNDLLKYNLKQAPQLGTYQPDGTYEYCFGGYLVKYALLIDREGVLITLLGIRPQIAISNSEKTKRLIKKALDLWKEVKGVF